MKATKFILQQFVCLSEWSLTVKKTCDPFLFPHSRVFFIYQEIFEKAASAVPLRPLDFLAASFPELKIVLNMKLDHSHS